LGKICRGIRGGDEKKNDKKGARGTRFVYKSDMGVPRARALRGEGEGTRDLTGENKRASADVGRTRPRIEKGIFACTMWGTKGRGKKKTKLPEKQEAETKRASVNVLNRVVEPAGTVKGASRGCVRRRGDSL